MWIPAVFNMNTIQPCLSCVLRLTSTVAGPGNVSLRTDGLLINENPLTTLTVNGIQHTLLETILTFPGAHRLQGREGPCEAELFMYFRSIKNLSDIACLAIPMDVGSGPSTKYFRTLDAGVLRNRPSVGTVIPESPTFISYRGADIRGRTATNSTPRALCDPINSVVTYYLSTKASKIDSADLRRLMGRSGTQRVGPAKPTSPPVNDRIQRICSLITNVAVDIGGPAAKKAGPGGYDTSAMKCYRIDPSRDVRGGRVYVGAEAEKASTLKKELTPEVGLDDDLNAGIQPGDIERVLGIVLGVLVGLVVCATVAFYIWNKSFRNYLEAQNLYKAPLTTAGELSDKAPFVFSLSSLALPSLLGWTKKKPECEPVAPQNNPPK